jgi:hypothetical protein
MSTYYYKCVLILLYMCPNATIYASSYCFSDLALGETWLHQPYATIYICVSSYCNIYQPYATINASTPATKNVSASYYMCPYATICVSSYCYILGEKWFHQPNHMSPEEAVQCREDLRAAHAGSTPIGTATYVSSYY